MPRRLSFHRAASSSKFQGLPRFCDTTQHQSVHTIEVCSGVIGVPLPLTKVCPVFRRVGVASWQSKKHAAEPCQSQRVTVHTLISKLPIYTSPIFTNPATNVPGTRGLEDTRRMAGCIATSNFHASPAKNASHDHERPAPQPPPRQGTKG